MQTQTTFETTNSKSTAMAVKLLPLLVKERKGKEEYIAPFCTEVHTKRSGMDHTVLPANNTMPAFPSWTFSRWHHHNNWGSRHPISAYYITVHYIYNYYNTTSWLCVLKGIPRATVSPKFHWNSPRVNILDPRLIWKTADKMDIHVLCVQTQHLNTYNGILVDSEWPTAQ